jgi:rhodanese-related sulfurtransferase
MEQLMLKKLIFALTLVFISLLNVSVQELHAEPPKEKTFQSIGPQDALRMLQARDDVVFLDVRTPEERSRGAIPGSRLVSIVDLVNGRIPLPRDKAILLVCAVGGRSYVAGQILSKKGYKEVYNLSGGVKGWYKAGLPLTYDNPLTAK